MKQRFDPIEGRNAEIIEAVMACPEVLALPDDLQFKVRLCVEEVEENILCYSGSTWVEVWTAVEDNVFTVGFRDGGVEFDPLAKPDPDITSSLETRQVGGLGIFICKQMMDDLEYRFMDKCNIFIMRKKIA